VRPIRSASITIGMVAFRDLRISGFEELRL
jgi:hypothetical protein